MRHAVRGMIGGVVALAVLVGLAGRAGAGAVNPGDFPLSDSGVFPTEAGTFTFDTRPTLTGPGITTPIRGTLSATGIAVFDFDAINVTGGQTFLGTGSLPLALLSRTDATIAGRIDGSGQGLNSGSLGGPGGGGGGSPFTGPGGQPGPGGGPGGGGPGVTTLFVMPPIFAISSTSGGGGGGFGGSGGAGGPFDRPPGGLGGAPYGDLARQLQGGSGGGGSYGPGAGGGGAIEIGAVGPLTISGSILARGGGSLFLWQLGGGGGSGGGILLHANSVLLTGSLSAAGGDGSEGFGPTGGPGSTSVAPGGGGGGGRVTILSGPGGFVESGATINVAGGAGGGAGVIDIAFAPRAGEPGAPGYRPPRTLGAWWLRFGRSRAADEG